MYGCKGSVGGWLLGKPWCCYPSKDGETDESPVAYRAPLHQALIDENAGHVNVVVAEAASRTQAWD